MVTARLAFTGWLWRRWALWRLVVRLARARTGGRVRASEVGESSTSSVTGSLTHRDSVAIHVTCWALSSRLDHHRAVEHVGCLPRPQPRCARVGDRVDHDGGVRRAIDGVARSGLPPGPPKCLRTWPLHRPPTSRPPGPRRPPPAARWSPRPLPPASGEVDAVHETEAAGHTQGILRGCVIRGHRVREALSRASPTCGDFVDGGPGRPNHIRDIRTTPGTAGSGETTQ